MTGTQTVVPIIGENIAVMNAIAQALREQLPELQPVGFSPKKPLEPSLLITASESSAFLMVICTDPLEADSPRWGGDRGPSLFDTAKLFAGEHCLKVVCVSSDPETCDHLSEAGCVYAGRYKR